MIRNASEHFDRRLLSEDERKNIIDSILSGPSKDRFRERIGERYSEDIFLERRRNFHRRQLLPFEKQLIGDSYSYLNELKEEVSPDADSDDSYSPFGTTISGRVIYKSPRSREDLDSLNDEELLTYLNGWNDRHQDKNNWLIEINITALAGVFECLFKENIVPNDKRLNFWLENRNRIDRPVYIATMLKVVRDLINEKNFDNLGRWIEFCTWILSHPVIDPLEGQPELGEESSDYPDWSSSRRAVVDFIDACVKKDTEAPISSRSGLADLLQLVCNQSDKGLDGSRLLLLNHGDPITEAINNTRSRALESLINFGFWVRRQLTKDHLPEVTEILTKRLAEDAKTPLTPPEYALLGMHFGDLCILNKDWAARERKALFPRENENIWRNAFGSYIRTNGPAKLTFEILRCEFEFAIDHLNTLVTENGDGKERIDRLGQHLFAYYLWGVYTLQGSESLLKRFYGKTQEDRKRWGRLFDHIGRSLRNSGRQLDKVLIDRILEFFNWRYDVAEPLELQEFTFWLEAECLDSKWRLQSYSKILDLLKGMDIEFYLQLSAINKLLPNHLELVVECFAKITDLMHQDDQSYISADEAKPILKAGLIAEEAQVRENAERARENLLRLGHFGYLEVNDY